MVCRADQICQIHFRLFYGTKYKLLSNDRYVLRASTRGKDLYDYIEEQCQIDPEIFKLYLLTSEKVIDLSKMKDKTMSEVGVDFSYDRDSSEVKHKLIVADPADYVLQALSEYDIPIQTNVATTVAPPPDHQPVWGEDGVNFKSFIKAETNYVGLVNQAMTCYLNSLLQALYMTPEFRNALYNWEYVDGSEKDEANSIPYQLQKLFLNLQTSTKSAVETTALTKSFGWDSTEAWQQHDIQELCRVMFDALEQKFKNTEQADLINRLYEGKMIDYVKCLECGTEKSREDTFLDIPLPVRPFGSNVTYNSVEEAMRAFVQYETLEGANQYHCEKCNKKCDAHKGLKFTKFPYLLTLHLKRFDFDYKTFHRIKLNDKVTFPDVLNLNSFISSTSNQESPAGEEDIGVGVKCDDSSTTDSGTLDDDCPPCGSSLTNSNHSTNHDQDDDEGIDMSNGPSTSNCTHNHENEKNRSNFATAKGPYVYELFSIMIHSGSASGGHYYAFIKDFRTQEWLSFNDQNVTQITYDDIQKTYGGGPTRAYYSGAYSSSTNAYMLMYRQIDPARNVLPMQAHDFPKHIQELLKKMKESEDNDRINRKKLLSIPRLKVYCHHPTEGKLIDTTLYVMNVTWADVTEQVYEKFHLEKIVSLNQCRLVSYDHDNDLIECSYDGREQETVESIGNNQNRLNLLLEIRRKDQKFETYLPGGVMTKVFVIDVPGEELIEGPISVRGLLTQTVREYKQMVGKIINMDPKQMKLVLRNYPTETRLIEKDDSDLQSEGFYNSSKVIVSTMLDTDSTKPFHESALCDIAEILTYVVSLQVQLPDTSKEILEELNIPVLEEKSKDKEKPAVNGPSKLSVNDTNREVSLKCNDIAKTVRSNDDAPVRNISPQLGEGEEWNTPEQSNSEDSSLSDSDKTLVGDAPEDDDFQLPYLPPSKSDNRTIDMLNQIGIENWDIDDNSVYYFKATPQPNSNEKLLKIVVDKRMKLSSLKKSLEPYVGVSAEYFKIFHHSVESGESECSCLTEQLSSYEDCERLTIKLGRALRSGEFKIKLYQLLIDSAEPFKFLCEWIVSKDMTVGQAKREILAEIKRKYDIDIPFERCRLRKKYYRTATKVCLDDQTFEDIRFYTQFEMIIQELPDKEPVTDSNQVVLFVRRWSPSKMQLGPFQEIVMDDKSIEEMRKKLSLISDIPEEHIDIARGKGGFPCEISVLKIQYDHDWNEYTLDGFSLTCADGCVFLYRDNREKLKQLTHDEAKEIVTKETSRLIPLSTTLNYSPRRERALKIYLDTK